MKFDKPKCNDIKIKCNNMRASVDLDVAHLIVDKINFHQIHNSIVLIKNVIIKSI